MPFRCENHSPATCEHFKPVCRNGHSKIPGKKCKQCALIYRPRSIEKCGKKNWHRDNPEKSARTWAAFNAKHPGRRNALKLLRYYRKKKNPTPEHIKKMADIVKKYPPLRPMDWGLDLSIA